MAAVIVKPISVEENGREIRKDLFYNGSGRSSEYPDAVEYSCQLKAVRIARKIKNRPAVLNIVDNYGYDNESVILI